MKKNKNSIDKKTAELQFLLSISNIIVNDLTIKEILLSFTEKACELCAWPIGRVTYLSNTTMDEKSFYLNKTKNTETINHLKKQIIKKNPISSQLYESVIASKKSIFGKHNKTKTETIYSLVIPIPRGDTVVATIDLFSDDISSFEESFLELIDGGAKQIEGFLLKKEAQLKLKKSFTDLQSTQEQLIQSEKMASLGTIAAGVAHEINNPLSFLLSNIESLEIYMNTFRNLIDLYEKLENELPKNLINPQTQEILSKIENTKKRKDVKYIMSDYENLLKESLIGVFRIREIVQGLKTFSRPYDDKLEKVDINECIKSALRVLSNELKYKCTLKKNFSKLPPILCNPGHLFQVFINIILNGIQAIKDKGNITIKTYTQNEFVCISITDNGCGISQENQKKLFMPFFTTKPVGEGTGLGLSVSYGIIKNLKGTITVESEKDKGTQFLIKIPYNL